MAKETTTLRIEINSFIKTRIITHILALFWATCCTVCAFRHIFWISFLMWSEVAVFYSF